MKETSPIQVLSDGALDFGNGVIGPNDADRNYAEATFQRLVRDSYSTAPLVPKQLPDRVNTSRLKESIGTAARSFFDRFPIARLGLQLGLPSLALTVVMAACGGGGSKSENQPEPTARPVAVERQREIFNESRVEQDQEAILPLEGLSYYNAGPHYFEAGTSRVRNAVDIAVPEVVNCPGGKPLENRNVISPVDGRVILVGDDTNSADQNHSVVVIEAKDGIDYGLMHVSGIGLHVGQEVNQGEYIGHPSCDHMPEGYTSGIHIHLFVKKDGKPIPIAGFVFSGWQVHQSPENNDGTMTKAGFEVRTADESRCGPDEALIRRCGGIRNDLGDERSVAMPVQVPQNQNMALVLDGDGDGLVVENSQSLELRNAVTIEARIKLTSVGKTLGKDTILAKGEKENEAYALWPDFWHCYKDGGFAPGGYLSPGFTSGSDLCGDSPVAVDQWVNLALTYDGHFAILYVNGVEVGREAREGLLAFNDEPLHIGQSPFPGAEDCTCSIDWVKLWNTARTPDQMRMDFEGNISVVEEETQGEVGNWQFNGDTNDSTSNHNNGMIKDGAYLDLVAP